MPSVFKFVQRRPNPSGPGRHRRRATATVVRHGRHCRCCAATRAALRTPPPVAPDLADLAQLVRHGIATGAITPWEGAA